MNRIVLLLFVAALLMACGGRYDRIHVKPLMGGGGVAVSDITLPPIMQRYQKRWYGHSDIEERRKDMIECGASEDFDDFKYSRLSEILLSPVLGEKGEQRQARMAKFRQCMRDKDYLELGLSECGPVKEERGICK